MEYVFSEKHGIVIVEQDDDNDFSRFFVYVEGEWVGTAFDIPEAREIAQEVLASLGGDAQQEDPEDIG